MTDQSQATPEETQFKQVALWEAYVLQLALEKVQVPDIDEISIIYLYIYIYRKMGLKYSYHW